MNFFKSKKPLDRSTAWAYLMSNLFLIPGMGSLMAGRLLAGVAQMVGSIFGFILTLIAMIRVVFSFNWEADAQEPFAYMRPVYLGIGIFAASWVWGLITGIQVLRDAPPDAGSTPKDAPKV